MKIIEKLKSEIKKYTRFYYYIQYLRYLFFVLTPSKYRIKILWNRMVSYSLNLKNPKTFNEKIQWLKLYYRNPLLKICSNKITVRDYVKEKIGSEYLNNIIRIYDSIDLLNLDELPEKFVIKCSHDSGSTKIIKDKNIIKKSELILHFKYCMKINYYHISKEWGYDNTDRKIIVESFIESENRDLKDYKIFCFWGIPKLIQVDIDRHTNHKRNIYDTDWNYIDLSILYPNDPSKIELPPKLLEKMLNLSSILSEPFPHVRVDWYIDEKNNKLIFGEMTFYHGGGYEPFSSLEWELKMGEWIRLDLIDEKFIRK